MGKIMLYNYIDLGLNFDEENITPGGRIVVESKNATIAISHYEL